MSHRPVSVSIVAVLYVIAGVAGILYHGKELVTPGGITLAALGILLVRLLAIVAGISLFLGRRWARWLVIGWMAFHVIVRALNSPEQFVFHLVFLILLCIVLFRTSVNLWLSQSKTNEGK